MEARPGARADLDKRHEEHHQPVSMEARPGARADQTSSGFPVTHSTSQWKPGRGLALTEEFRQDCTFFVGLNGSPAGGSR